MAAGKGGSLVNREICQLLTGPTPVNVTALGKLLIYGFSAIWQTRGISLLFPNVICLTAFYLYLRRNYDYWQVRGVPYESPSILCGNLGFFLRKSFWEYFYKVGKSQKLDYVGIFLGWKPALLIQSPELARKILITDHVHFQNRYIYSPNDSDPLGSLNLFTVKNPIWTIVRKELSPLFTSKKLKMVTDLMNVNSKELVLKIQRDYIDKKEKVNLKELFSMYTSDTVASTVFGITVSALNDEPSPLWVITNHMIKWTFWRGFEFSTIFFLPALAEFLRLKLFSAPASEYIKKIFWKVVNERNVTGETNDKDLVNLLLKLKADLKLPVDANSDLANDLMLAQVAVFILGSIETSSSTLTYCLHEIAHHPDKQEKLFGEINEAVNKRSKSILDYNDLVELKYLSKCIYETLRMYTPVPHIDRLCNKDYKLNDKVTIEAGTPVLVNALAIHYDERHYPDPEQWYPERFSDSMTDSDNLQFSFLPFGEGPRFCIGKRYGLMQVRTALAQILHQYRVLPDENEPRVVKADPYSVLLAPLSGVLSVIFLTAFYLYLRRNYDYWQVRGVPYQQPSILFGNLGFFLRKSFSEYFYEVGKKQKLDYLGIFLGWKPALLIQSPELARKILITDHVHFQNRYIYSPNDSDPLGSLNLFNVKNPLWKSVRKQLSPIFTSKKLKMVTELMNVNSKELVHKIQRDYIDKKKAVNLKELFSMYTSDTVSSTVFGITVSVLNDLSSPLWVITKHMLNWTFWRGFEFSTIFFLPALAKILRLKFFSASATEYIKQLFSKVIEERKITSQRNDKDLVCFLLKLKADLKLPVDADSDLANDLMMAQAAVFILGSIETSSSNLSYCLHELAHHPDKQEKLFNEINEALNKSAKCILEYEDLIELKYMSKCIYETLRMYAPLPHMDRLCNKDYKLNDEVTIEAGTPVLVNVLAIHYDERHYRDPEQWCPERFPDTMTDSDNLQCTFLPFGEGPRFCIGKRYGLMQIRTALAQIFHKYRVLPGENEPRVVKPDPYSVLLAPLSGGCVKFVPR
ncbi:hypothetical protein K1T71_003161 [Dendrolimus kikuchii]|uniref:Uncharacterized protein n=1 Tax=Dendrolimus kikuchii TaxID=765133 RepID=A0ACC1DB12_9NEOP|nr:hypothetical protein K1T71_003161 [Dendrolimus kikuchii]